MNVKELNEKYQRIVNWQDEYRKELISYIDEAFAMHGNKFEYKCNTHATWQEKNEDEEDDFNAMNDLPVCVTVWVDDEGGHEVYPTCIRRYVSDSGYKTIEVDGWDWHDSDWVEGQDVNGTIDELQSIAEFINAVLEQELLKVGTKCKWNDPGIEDYPEELREEVLNRVFTIEEINGEIILISDEDGTEAEVFACELELLY